MLPHIIRKLAKTLKLSYYISNFPILLIFLFLFTDSKLQFDFDDGLHVLLNSVEDSYHNYLFTLFN